MISTACCRLIGRLLPALRHQDGLDRAGTLVEAGIASWAEDRVSQSAPSAAIPGRMCEAGADVPAALGGHVSRWQFLRMQTDGTITYPLVPLDEVAAFPAAGALGTAEVSG
jgi:hypothetical protein